MIDKDITGCAKLRILPEYPPAISYNTDFPDIWPHLSFEVDPSVLTENFTIEVFLHFETKVCITNVENCFGECSEIAGNDPSSNIWIPRPRTVNYENRMNSSSKGYAKFSN